MIEKWRFGYTGTQKELVVLEHRTGTPYQYEIEYFPLHPNDIPIWVKEGVAMLDLAIMGDYEVELPGVGSKRFGYYELIYKGTRWERVELGCMRFLRGWRGGALGVILATIFSLIMLSFLLVLCATLSASIDHSHINKFVVLWMISWIPIIYTAHKLFIECPKEKE